MEKSLRQRVVQFWNQLNEQLVPDLISKIGGRKLFGNEKVDEAILFKLYEGYYTDISSNKRDKNSYVIQYNRLKDFNEKYGLPGTVTDLIELRDYGEHLSIAKNEAYLLLKKIPRMVQPTTLEGEHQRLEIEKEHEGYQGRYDCYKAIIYLLSSDYFDYGIDFSSEGAYNKEYVFEMVNDIGNNQFRQEAIPNIVEGRFLNEYLCLPETYDLVLRLLPNHRAKIDKTLLKYALFLAFLEEQKMRAKTTIESRFIFTYQELREIVKCFDGGDDGIPDRGDFIKKELLAYPVIPPKSYRLPDRGYTSYMISLKKIPSENGVVYKYDEPYISDELQEMFDLDDFLGVRYNVNGSVLGTLLNVNFSFNDIDIRLDYADGRGEYLPDQLFEKAVQNLKSILKLGNLNKILLNGDKKYKYQTFYTARYEELDLDKEIKVEIYRSSFGFISNYHVDAVRMNYDKVNGLVFYPSGADTWLTGYCKEIRFFSTENNNPMEVVEKYNKRGFGFFLNPNEYGLYLSYLAREEMKDPDYRYDGHLFEILFNKNSDVDFFTEMGYLPKDIEENDLPEGMTMEDYGKLFLRLVMFRIHNYIYANPDWLIATDRYLPTPFE